MARAKRDIIVSHGLNGDSKTILKGELVAPELVDKLGVELLTKDVKETTPVVNKHDVAHEVKQDSKETKPTKANKV